MPSTIRIAFFGTGGSWPSPGRNVMSVGLQIDSEVILFDCGEGTQRQIMCTKISFMKIKKIFITHFHGDHFLGLAGLIQTMVLNNRTEPLEIYGPEGAVNILTSFLSVGYYSLSFPIRIYEVKSGDMLDFGEYLIRVLGAEHPVPALSYLFKEKDIPRIDREKAEALSLNSRLLEKLRKDGHITHNGREVRIDEVAGGIRHGRKIVYSGDTAPTREMQEFAKDADVLIHEATADSSLEKKANQYGHSSARQAAEIAKKAGVRALAMVHISPRYKNPKVLVDEAREIFPNAWVPSDLEEYQVKVRKNLD